jgi:anti-sigma B factor antagonist
VKDRSAGHRDCEQTPGRRRRFEVVLNVRFDGDVAILSNFGGLLNDPRHFDAGRDVGEILDRGCRKFVFELAGIREMGSTALALLTTLTRLVRQGGGEAVLARVGRGAGQFLEEMRMDDYWDVFESVEEAKESFRRTPT